MEARPGGAKISTSEGAPAQRDPEGFDREKRRGDRLAEQERFQEAAVAYEAALRCDETAAALRLELARICLFHLQDPGRATPHLKLVERELAEDPAPPYLLAKVAFSEGRLSRVEEYLATSIERDPEYAEAWILRGQVHEGRGQLEQAAECFQRVLAFSPDHVGALFELGRLAVQSRDFEDGERRLQRVLELDPGHAGAHLNYARCLQQAGREEDARRHLEIQRLLTKLDQWYHVDRNIGELRTELLLELIAVHPSYGRPYYLLANALLAQGATRQAIEVLEGLAELKPDASLPHRELARLYELDGDREASERARARYEELRKK